MKDLKFTWDGEPSDEEFERLEQYKAELKLIFPDLTIELIGTRPKSRG